MRHSSRIAFRGRFFTLFGICALFVPNLAMTIDGRRIGHIMEFAPSTGMKPDSVLGLDGFIESYSSEQITAEVQCEEPVVPLTLRPALREVIGRFIISGMSGKYRRRRIDTNRYSLIERRVQATKGGKGHSQANRWLYQIVLVIPFHRGNLHFEVSSTSRSHFSIACGILKSLAIPAGGERINDLRLLYYLRWKIIEFVEDPRVIGIPDMVTLPYLEQNGVLSQVDLEAIRVRGIAFTPFALDDPRTILFSDQFHDSVTRAGSLRCARPLFGE